jgi:aldehyde:ferredoxin oxidoreductase
VENNARPGWNPGDRVNEREQAAGRAQFHKVSAEYMHVVNSAGLCFFVTMCGPNDQIHEWINAVTGWDYSREELLGVGERVMHLERAFNVRHGLRPADDWTVPDRLIEAPADGPAKGVTIKPYLEGMVKEYHRLMGSGQDLPGML